MSDKKPELLYPTDMEDAIVGVCHHDWRTEQPLVVMDQNKIIDILMERDGMSYEEAQEFFDYNIAGAHMGPGTPLFVEPMTKEELDDYADELEP